MGEAFKEFIGERSVGWLGRRVAGVLPGFDVEGFQRESMRGLGELELKARVAHVAAALRAHLPSDYLEALGPLVEALPEPLGEKVAIEGMFGLWPVLTFVELYGLEHPRESLVALREMTRRFSAEFAVRPYIIQDTEGTLAKLLEWAEDEDQHVRRWVSEGSRPRLPWGQRIPAIVSRPELTLPILQKLNGDSSEYVRRSVANHLADIAKDHPELAVKVARGWLEAGASDATVRHALRHLVKKGHAGALDVLGFRPGGVEVLEFSVSPERVELGSDTVVTAALAAESSHDAVVDLVLLYPRADGRMGRRVVKWSNVGLKEGEVWRGSKRISFRPVTTRVDRPGNWAVLLQVNGEEKARGEFMVQG